MNKNKPTVIIEVQGGCVTGISCDRAVNAVVVDHDTEGSLDEDLLDYPVSLSNEYRGIITKKVMANEHVVDRCAGFVKAALKTLKL
jgi:hypothetical protein